MDAVAMSAGAIAALALVLLAGPAGEAGQSAMVAGLALIAFMSTRLLEVARALHAHVGGEVALRRLERLLSPAAAGATSTGDQP
jgi:hypothetical protein